MKSSLAALEQRIGKVSGPDDRVDADIRAALDGDRDAREAPSYTASVDECIALIRRTLPDWHWHVGHGAMGVLPYASMTGSGGGDDPIHVEATAPTVPLALLAVLVKALNSG